VGGGVQLGSLGTTATNRPIVPAPGDYDDGEIGGMMIGRGNRSTRRKPGPVLLCLPQTPYAARTRTRAAAVGSQRLTAWATARTRQMLTTSIIETRLLLIITRDTLLQARVRGCSFCWHDNEISRKQNLPSTASLLSGDEATNQRLHLPEKGGSATLMV
jgi:hypothetical protein